MTECRGNIIRDSDSSLIEQTNKEKLASFAQPAEWADNDHLSQLPEDVLREILAYLNRFDVTIVRRVNQTLHAYIDKYWPIFPRKRADKLTVYQYKLGFAFKLEHKDATNCVLNNVYMMERAAGHYSRNSEEKRRNEFDEGSFYELRYEYKESFGHSVEQTIQNKALTKPITHEDYIAYLQASTKPDSSNYFNANRRFINVPIFFHRLENVKEVFTLGELHLEGICIDKDVLRRLEGFCVDSSPMSMLALRNVHFTDEICNDSMLSFISSLKPCSIEIDDTKIYHLFQISSERFLEAFTNDPDIRYSFDVRNIKDEHGLRFMPSKEFLERILTRFTYFRLHAMVVNSLWLEDLISIGLDSGEKMYWNFTIDYWDDEYHYGVEYRAGPWSAEMDFDPDDETLSIDFRCDDQQ